MSHRSADGEGALGKLQKLMTDLLVDNLWMVTVRAPASDGPRHYYATEQPAQGARSLRYLVGFDGKERTLKVVADWVEKIDVSPQTKIAQKFKPMLLQDPTQIDWEVTMLDLVDQVRTQPGMDPVLRVALLGKVLELGLEGSEPLQAALGRPEGPGRPGRRGRQRAVDGPREPRGRPGAAQGRGVRPALARPGGAAQGRAGPPGEGPAADDRTSPGGGLAGPRAGGLAGPHRGGRCRSRASSRSRSPGDDGHGAWKKIGVIDQGRPRLTVPTTRRWPRGGRSSSSPRSRPVVRPGPVSGPA